MGTRRDRPAGPAGHRADHVPDRVERTGPGQPVPDRPIRRDAGDAGRVLERAAQDGPLSPRSRCRSPAWASSRRSTPAAGRPTTSRCASAILYAVDKAGVDPTGRRGRLPGQQHAAGQGHDRLRRSARECYPYDPAKAEATLKAAGWTKTGEFWEKDGKPLTIKITAISTSTDYRCWRRRSRATCARSAWTRTCSRWPRRPGSPPTSRATCRSTALQYIAVDPDALQLWFTARPVFQLEPLHRPRPHRADPAGPAGERPGQAVRDLRARRRRS